MRTGPAPKNIDSVRSLRAFLEHVCERPNDFAADESLKIALRNQHALAKYACPERGITPLSLNTHKRLAALLDGGYAGLNSLRSKAAEQVKTAAQSTKKTEKRKRTVVGLSEKVGQLEGEVSVAVQDCWHLSTAFAAAIREGTNMAAEYGDKALQARWEKTRRELLSMVTLSSSGYAVKPEKRESDD